ncbi:hypothetical protein RF11_03094 [Thelohanellus kitauei]|uniref:Uncharacterized protein n=1 Tax=Thelohanellus kitauei TaxID=669202 RepID=A0A0C2MS64_THEKT|nr:hypothetical protein RF11_03094 [Thelohanellus kitauei]
MDIKCISVDAVKYIDISNCNMSYKNERSDKTHNHYFNYKWKIEKTTRYEIENQKKIIYFNQERTNSLSYQIINIFIEPKDFDRICRINKITADIEHQYNEIVSDLTILDFSNTNLTCIQTNKVNIDSSSETKKFFNKPRDDLILTA